MKKFKKEFLKEVMMLNQEEVKLVMECQRLFPELLENEATEINSAKKLYEQIGLNKTQWARWYKKNILENEFFLESKDWKPLDMMTSADKSRADGNFAKDFSISVEFAKHLTMMARTENSHKFRNYFILIEKSVRGMQEHLVIREPEKQGYNKMKEEIIKDYSNKHSDVAEFDKRSLMIRESNMINKKLLGYTASEIKDKLGYMDKRTREHLELRQNKTIDFLQSIIIGLVAAGIDFEERSKIIENICNNKYSDLKMV